MSKSTFDENNNLFAPFIAASGMFTSNTGGIPLYQGLTGPKIIIPGTCSSSLYNPMPPTVPQAIKEAVPLQQQQSFIKEFHGAKRHKLFDIKTFDSYAQALFERLVPELLRHDHDILLFPLRGCRQPGILVKVIAGIPETKMVIFNFTYATRDSQQPLIELQLTEQLRKKVPETGIVSVGVVDTAKGGYGSRKLAQLLSQIHSRHFSKQDWSVQFHLLHKSEAHPTQSGKIPKYRHESLSFPRPTFYPVESLLVEDWPEGIGLAVNESGRYCELKRCVEPGLILYRDEDSIQLIASEAVCDTMTGLTVDAVNRLMLTSPEIEYVKDVWKADMSIGNGEGAN